VGEWQRILVGMPSVSKSEGAKRCTTYQNRATIHGARGSASSKGNPLLMLASLVMLTMVLMALSTILTPRPNPPISLIHNQSVNRIVPRFISLSPPR
jgi:hypothetical protein